MMRKIASTLFLVLFAANCSSGGNGSTTTTGPSADTSAQSTDPTSTGAGTTEVASTEGSAVNSIPDALTADDLFLPDPTVGLAAATSYHQEMTLTVTGTSTDTTDTYVRDHWAGIGTSTSIRMTTAAGVTDLLVGDLGQSAYIRPGADAACAVHWSETGSPEAPVIEPAAMLPRVVTATETGRDVRDGLAATGYRFDAVVSGMTGTGELWLADDTGMMLSYSLDLIDGAATHSYRYTVTSVDALGEASLPDGCAPVLESIPAIDGASNVQRLPGGLDYSTASTGADVVAFYEQSMPGLGWTSVGARSDDSAQTTTMFFENTTTAQAASIFIEFSDGATWVSVIVRDATVTAG